MVWYIFSFTKYLVKKKKIKIFLVKWHDLKIKDYYWVLKKDLISRISEKKMRMSKVNYLNKDVKQK